MNEEKNRFNVEEHTTLDNKIIDVFPISHRYIHDLEQQVKKQKEIIDKAIEYIEGHKYTMKHHEPYGTPTGLTNYETYNIRGYYELLNILNEVSE